MIRRLAYRYRQFFCGVFAATFALALLGAADKKPDKRMDCVTIEHGLGLTPSKPLLARSVSRFAKGVAGADVTYIDLESGFTVDTRLIGSVQKWTPPGYDEKAGKLRLPAQQPTAVQPKASKAGNQ